MDQRGRLLGAALAILLTSCIRYSPPAVYGTFGTDLGPGDREAVFRTLVSVVNRNGHPIQFSDSAQDFCAWAGAVGGLPQGLVGEALGR